MVDTSQRHSQSESNQGVAPLVMTVLTILFVMGLAVTIYVEVNLS